ncbi:uncharacterized protein CANTADRAFT_27052 [Suhomyces tanzawaensis NRRL Y-17324]|uniref:Uncharacterized protein n=1 Tax=Suhomyces tanzawaensis NRRL Y-17324 TaxID=984487 RepID=A0A1E4SF69_9ASCO|nr:uncharacterized protein CANTADRAFT_27052 [Suhomyces tanzawaensis NRRL Y-17324]ODV78126.1 hypothetical protein CANTADRAFT_27052 [Suhomyces tanzawaensis NRRL Y-17324]
MNDTSTISYPKQLLLQIRQGVNLTSDPQPERLLHWTSRSSNPILLQITSKALLSPTNNLCFSLNLSNSSSSLSYFFLYSLDSLSPL